MLAPLPPLALALVLVPLVFSISTISLPEATSPPVFISLIIYRHAVSSTPCSGVNGTVNWPLDYVKPNSTGSCFDDSTTHLTCIRRRFQQSGGVKVDTEPRICSFQGFQQRDCEGPSFPASYNGAAEWTWDGVDMNINVQSFRMICAQTGAASTGVDGD